MRLRMDVETLEPNTSDSTVRKRRQARMAIASISTRQRVSYSSATPTSVHVGSRLNRSSGMLGERHRAGDELVGQLNVPVLDVHGHLEEIGAGRANRRQGDVEVAQRLRELGGKSLLERIVEVAPDLTGHSDESAAGPDRDHADTGHRRDSLGIDELDRHDGPPLDRVECRHFTQTRCDTPLVQPQEC
jgi:hypothetical protein